MTMKSFKHIRSRRMIVEAAPPSSPVKLADLFKTAFEEVVKQYKDNDPDNKKTAKLFMRAFNNTKNGLQKALIKKFVDLLKNALGSFSSKPAAEKLGKRLENIPPDSEEKWTEFTKWFKEQLTSVSEEAEEEVYEQNEEDPWVNQWFNAYERKSKEGAIDSFDESDLEGDVIEVTAQHPFSFSPDSVINTEPEPMGVNEHPMFPVVEAPTPEEKPVEAKPLYGSASIYDDKVVAPVISDPKGEDYYSTINPITGQLSAKGGTTDEKWIRSKMRVLQQRGLFRDFEEPTEPRPTDVYVD